MYKSAAQDFGQHKYDTAIIVAHPDDEVLWAGGMILAHQRKKWFAAALCRKSDPDRAPKFFRTLKYLHISGNMGDMNDDAEQTPLLNSEIQDTILSLLPQRSFELVLTHGPCGEYTRHLRHEEISRAVIALWETGAIKTKALWTFAYEDGGGRYLPRPVKNADKTSRLSKKIWQEKYYILTKIYGFKPDSFEAMTTPREETFWCFDSPEDFRERVNKKGGLIL